MPGHDLIVVGASAGGVEALVQLMRRLPADLPAAVFVVLHVPAQSPSLLADILNRAGPLRATHVRDRQPIEHGWIYVAPPDRHLLIRDGHVMAAHGPKENGHRPALDPLFRTAARAHGPRVVGVVLSGNLDDGTAGLMTVKRYGGVAIVQDPEEALYASMPRSAMENVAVDHVLPVAGIAAEVSRLAHEPVQVPDPSAGPSVPGQGAPPMGDGPNRDEIPDVAEAGADGIQGQPLPGTPSQYTCPECGGAIWELRDGELIRFRCHVGHAYSAETFLAEKTEALEAAMWVALRSLKENAALARRLSHRALEGGHVRTAEAFEQQASDAERRAQIISEALTGDPDAPRKVELADPARVEQLRPMTPVEQDTARRQESGGNGAARRPGG